MAVLNFTFGGFDVASTSGKLKAAEKVQSAELVSRQSGKIARTFKIAAMLPITTASRVETTYLQSTVRPTLAPTSPREMLYYATLAGGKFGRLTTVWGSTVSGIAYNQPFGKLNISAGRLASAGPVFTVSTLPKQLQRLTSISTRITADLVSRQAITVRTDRTSIRADLITKQVIKSNANEIFYTPTLASTKIKIAVKSDTSRFTVEQLPRRFETLQSVAFDKTPQIISKFKPIVPFVFNSNTLFGKSQAITKISGDSALVKVSTIKTATQQIKEAAVNKLITARTQHKTRVVPPSAVRTPSYSTATSRIYGSSIASTGYDESTGKVVITMPYQHYDGSYDVVKLTGTTRSTIPAPQYGIAFNGTSQYLSIPYTNFLLNSSNTSTQPFAVECWVKLDSLNSSMILSEEYSPNTIHMALGIGPAPAPAVGAANVWFGFYDFSGVAGPATTWNYLTSSSSLALNTWYHISAQFTGSSMNIYVNGQLNGTKAQAAWANIPGQATNLFIGRRWDTSTADGTQVYFPGTISNLRIVKGRVLRTGFTFELTDNFDGLEANTVLAINGPLIADTSSYSNTITPINAPQAVGAALPVSTSTITVDKTVFDGDVAIYSYNETSVVIDAPDLPPTDRINVAFSKIVSSDVVSYNYTSPNTITVSAVAPEKYIIREVATTIKNTNKLSASTVVKDAGPRIRITDMLSRQAIQVRSEQTYKHPAPQINKLKAIVKTLELPVLGKTKSITPLVGDRLLHTSGKAKTITTLTSSFDRYKALSAVQPYTAYDSTLVRITGRSGYTTNTPIWYAREQDILHVIPTGSNVITFFFGNTTANIIGTAAINYINLTNSSGTAIFSNLTVVSYDNDSITVYTTLTIPVGNYYAQIARNYLLNVYSDPVGKITKAVVPIVQPIRDFRAVEQLPRQFSKLTSVAVSLTADKLLPKRDYLQETIRISSTGAAKVGIVVKEDSQVANSIMPMRQFKTRPTPPVVNQFEIAPLKQSIIVKTTDYARDTGMLARRAFVLTATSTPITTDRVRLNPIVRSVPTIFTLGQTVGVDALKNKFAQIPFEVSIAKLFDAAVVRGDRTQITTGKATSGITLKAETNTYRSSIVQTFKTTANDISVFKYYTLTPASVDTYEAPIDVSSYTVGAANTTFNFNNRHYDGTNSKIRLLGYRTENTVKYLTTASYALTFSSTNYYQISDTPSLNFANAYSWTAECWLRPTGNYGTYNTIFAKRLGTLTAYEGYLRAGSGVIGFYNGTTYESTYTLPANVWSHCAWVYNLGVIKIYVNGVEVLSQAVANIDVPSPLVVGAFNNSPTLLEFFFGAMANFRMLKGVALYTGTFNPVSSIDPLVPATVLAVNDSYVRDTSSNNLSLGGLLPAVSITTLPGSPLSIPDTIDTIVLDTLVPIDSYTSTNVVISNISNLDYTQFSKVKVEFVNTVNTQTQSYTTLALPLDVDSISKPIVKLTSVRPVDVLGKTNAVVKLETFSLDTQISALPFKWRMPVIPDNLGTTARASAITKINGEPINYFNTGKYTKTDRLVDPINEAVDFKPFTLTIKRFLTEVSPSIKNINYISKAKILAAETATAQTFRVSKVNLGNTLKGDVNRFFVGKTRTISPLVANYDLYKPIGKVNNWKWPSPTEPVAATTTRGLLQKPITVLRTDATPVLRLDKLVPRIVVKDSQAAVRFSIMTKLKSYVSHINPVPTVNKLQPSIRVVAVSTQLSVNRVQSAPWYVREAKFNNYTFGKALSIPKVIGDTNRFVASKATNITRLRSATNLAGLAKVALNQFVRSPSQLNTTINKVDNTYLQTTVRPQTSPTTPRDMLYYSTIAPGRYGKLFAALGSSFAVPVYTPSSGKLTSFTGATFTPFTGVRATQFSYSGFVPTVQKLTAPIKVKLPVPVDIVNRVETTYAQSTLTTTTSPTTPREMLYYANLAKGLYGREFVLYGTEVATLANNFTLGNTNDGLSVRGLSQPTITLSAVDNTYLQSGVRATSMPATPRERLFFATLTGKYARPFYPYGDITIGSDLTPLVQTTAGALTNQFFKLATDRNTFTPSVVSTKIVVRDVPSSDQIKRVFNQNPYIGRNFFSLPQLHIADLLDRQINKLREVAPTLDLFSVKVPNVLTSDFSNLKVEDFKVLIKVSDSTVNTPINSLLIQGTPKFKSDTGVIFETPWFASGGVKNVLRAEPTAFYTDLISTRTLRISGDDNTSLSAVAKMSIKDIIKPVVDVGVSGIVNPRIRLINDRTSLDFYTTRVATKITAVDTEFKAGKATSLDRLIASDNRTIIEELTRPKFSEFGYIFYPPTVDAINKNITAFKEVHDYRALAGVVWPGFKARGVDSSFEHIALLQKYKGPSYSPVGFDTPFFSNLNRQLLEIRPDPNRFLVERSLVLTKLVEDQEIHQKILGKILKAQGSGVAGDSVIIPTAGRVKALQLMLVPYGDELVVKTQGELMRMRLNAKEISDPTVRRTIPIQFWN
jgi:hypothetical protein